ncbi:tyrosine-type recombinase/integrase [Thermosulfurimonas dismutans]|uniref:Site-specific integrase n=1 Tax=Thermosulfurimonas dismutans TaxID=999894 RepID=A0A179D5G4_9BACT|nr:site-specific integrase [Thermosulfurimonas dismutans]OAQ21031.1 hypothetical protein TDIS_0957 [Thermosulfurimonas dismutans]
MKILMHLWRRENGIYYIVWRDRDGRQRMRSTRTRDKALARRIFNQFKRQWLAGKLVELDRGPKVPFGRFVEEFLRWAESTLKPATSETYRHALKHALEVFGASRTLDSIRSRDLDALLVHLRQKGLSPVSVNKVFRHLKAAFSKAVEWSYLRENPVKRGNPLRVQRELPRFLSQGEILRLLRAIEDPHFRAFVRFALFSGLRRSELLALTWEHLDLKRGFVRVPLGKGTEERFLPISSRLREVIEDLRALGVKGRLFPWSRSYVSHRFQRYARKAGLSGVRLHDLRHTFASHLVMAGVDIRTVQKLMGHADIKATMVYAQLSPDHLREAMERLNLGQEPHLRVIEGGRK